MARPPSTPDDAVFAAIRTLLAQGRTPHIRAIGEALGGRGSPTRIAALLDQFWEKHGPGALSDGEGAGQVVADKGGRPLPPALIALWETVRADAETQAVAAARHAVETEHARLDGREKGLRDQEDALAQRELALEERRADLLAQVKAADERAADARAAAQAAAAAAAAANEARETAVAAAVERAQKAEAQAERAADRAAIAEAAAQRLAADLAKAAQDLAEQKALVEKANAAAAHVRGQLDLAQAMAAKLSKELDAVKDALGHAEKLRAATGLQLADVRSELGVLKGRAEVQGQLVAELTARQDSLLKERLEALDAAKKLGERVELLTKDLAIVRAQNGSLETLLSERDDEIKRLTKERDAAVRAKDAVLASRPAPP